MVVRVWKTAYTFIALVVLAEQPASAAEYRVEFSKDGDGSQVVDMVSSEKNPTRWHTINDHDGVNLRNMAGFRIVSVRMKTLHTGDKFLIPTDAGKGLFKTVWKRKDNTEVVFMDGIINRSDIIWNRVNDSSGSTSTTGNIFEGQILPENYKIPDPDNWVMVRSDSHAETSERWRKLTGSLPSGYTSIQCYAESEDGQQIYFVSRGFPFVFDTKAEELRAILVTELIPKGINRIVVTKEAVEFWSNGTRLATVPLGKNLSEPIKRD